MLKEIGLDENGMLNVPVGTKVAVVTYEESIGYVGIYRGMDEDDGRPVIETEDGERHAPPVWAVRKI